MSFSEQYFNASASPWLVGMSDKAVRTARHKLVHWIHKDVLTSSTTSNRIPTRWRT
jgi:hypothetical protein